MRFAVFAVMLLAAGGSGACSPGYVLRAGFEEWKILRASEDIEDVLRDPEVDETTKSKLVLVLEARQFAMNEFGIDVGRAYSSYVELERDTLALIVSAAHRDMLVPKTWWFPIVGNVPYRGHFSVEDADEERMKLEAEGFDAMVRPTAAFSTLGWFDDPVLSTFLRYDDVEMITTLIHELAHLHLYVAGEGDFNESYATFVGRSGAVRFFCGRRAGGENTLKCQRARVRWEDVKLFGAYIDELRAELTRFYADTTLTSEEKIAGREPIFRNALSRFDAEVAPQLESLTFTGFRDTNLNNVTLLSRIRYYHRLDDFDTLLQEWEGDLAALLRHLKTVVEDVDDPWTLVEGPARDPMPSP